MKLHWLGLLPVSLAVQMAAEYGKLPGGYALLVVGLVLSLAFVVRNLAVVGMFIVLIGLSCNALVMIVNHGMPARGEPFTATARHHDQRPGDHLLILSDTIDAGLTWSVGDLILIAGAAVVIGVGLRKKETADVD